MDLKILKDIDENLEFTLDYLKEHVGLLAEGQWQDIIYGLDPEDDESDYEKVYV